MPDPIPTNLNAEDVIRHLTHELRQPLSALESIAYYLQLKMGESNADVSAQVQRLEQMVDNANWVLSDILHLLPMMPPNSAAVGVGELAEEVLAEAWVSEGLAIRQDFAEEMAPARVDVEQLRHLLRSVLQFLRRSADEPGTVTVSGISTADSVQIEFCAHASEVETESIFRPLVSNQLFTCRRIAENNLGHFTAEKDDGGRLRLRLDLPIAALA